MELCSAPQWAALSPAQHRPCRQAWLTFGGEAAFPGFECSCGLGPGLDFAGSVSSRAAAQAGGPVCRAEPQAQGTLPRATSSHPAP